MYSKEQASKIRQKFWTVFGQYMKPVPGAGDEDVNWVNYKTGVSGIYFRMDVTKQDATIAVEIMLPEESQRMQYYEQFKSLKKILEQAGNYEWVWEPGFKKDSGLVISRISAALHQVNVMNEADWPAIIEFLKPRIIALDKFWQSVKYGFE